MSESRRHTDTRQRPDSEREKGSDRRKAAATGTGTVKEQTNVNYPASAAVADRRPRSTLRTGIPFG